MHLFLVFELSKWISLASTFIINLSIFLLFCTLVSSKASLSTEFTLLTLTIYIFKLIMELGTPPTILQQLCNLPFNYFSDNKLIGVLYPTLICFCYGNEKNKSVLATEVNTSLLTHFIEEKINEARNKAGHPNNSDKFDLEKRFPRKLWQNACDYFRSTNENSD